MISTAWQAGLWVVAQVVFALIGYYQGRRDEELQWRRWRTYHRLACGIEDAGFELRDCLMWLYGKGFPKSQNVSLAIDKAAGAEQKVVGLNPRVNVYQEGKNHKFYTEETGNPAYGKAEIKAPATELAQTWSGYGTALKPAFEPICLARKPLEGTMAANVAQWGVGGLNIDGCRVGNEIVGWGVAGRAKDIWDESACGMRAGEARPVEGRWPANLLLDEQAAEILDAEVGPRKSGLAVRENGGGGQIFSGVGDQPYKPKPSLPNIGYMDGKTNPSRFFYTTKVSTKEREAGCGTLPLRSAGEVTDREDGSEGLDSPRAGAGRTGGARNHHPTLKPISLTTWLARLILPPTARPVLLVPFAGAGSEMIGAVKAGWPCVFGIEREAEYVRIAQARLVHWCAEQVAA